MATQNLSFYEEWGRKMVEELQKNSTFIDHVYTFTYAIDWNGIKTSKHIICFL